MKIGLRLQPMAVGAGVGAGAGVAWAHLYGEPGPVTTALLALAHAGLAGLAAGLADRLSHSATGAAPLAAFAAAVGWPIGAALALPTIAAWDRSAVLPALLVATAAAIGLIGLLARARPGRLVLLIAPLAALVPIVTPVPTPAPAAPDLPVLDVAGGGALEHVAVIGIDGGDWQVIDPMLAEGDLPTLRRLIETGVSATLMSAEPMFSPVVWTSIFTGAVPDDHGLTGWHSSLATNRRVPTLWDLLATRPQRSVVANVPGTWPPSIEAGAMLAGFPLPQLVTSADARAGQFFGVVVSESPRAGSVPTTVMRGGVARVPLGRARLAARTPLENAFVEAALRKRWLGGEMAWLGLEVSDDDRVRIDGRPVDLAVGEWSPWVDVELAEEPAFLRVRRLAPRRFYVTPPFASPAAARPPILAGDADLDALAPDRRYIVEGAGWKATADADLRDPLFEHLTHVHDLQSRALRALAASDWQLLAGVYTLTDRVQHAYWPYHAPLAFEPPPAPKEVAAHGDKVQAAYRRVDRALGQLLAGLPSETTVFVVSDHGVAADREAAFGGHRADGIFVAAGPGVAHRIERATLSIYDVAPTLLAGLGWPVADDLAGSARVELFEGDVEVARVPTYRSDASAAEARPDEIDGSTEEQLRALGYVD